MGPFRTLYIDMNSFFASVEQQLDPSLRGRPVAITAMENEKGCCVAASYEAKAHGVRTGTSVTDARRLCPGIVFLPSRHRLYVRFNLRIASVLDRYAEIERIRSVDEFQVALSGNATELDGAADLVGQLKAAVASEVGECLRFSAGIGPNHLLAKIAGKLEKPDGFQALWNGNMPGALAQLKLDDLPGISHATRFKLERSGVYDIDGLYNLDPRHARAIWRSIEGERFVRSLRGEPIQLSQTQRGGYGNSKVLAPEFRSTEGAYMVSRWLIEKAAARLRRDARVSSRYSLNISVMKGRAWAKSVSCNPAQDTISFLRINRALWRSAWPEIRGHKIAAISIYLGEVDLLSRRTGDLLLQIGPAEKTPSEQVSEAMDFINQRFGAGSIRVGLHQPHPGFFERG